MVFNSYIFILCFLPISLIGYYALGNTKKPPVYDWWLVLVSLFFYAFISPKMLIYPLVSCFINYFFVKLLFKKKYQKNGISISKGVLAFGILVNVLSLSFYKYVEVKSIIVPLGISFISFAQIAYLVDTYKGLTYYDSIAEYLLYVMWFPKVMQGPLLKHDLFIESLHNENRATMNYDNLSEGIFFFSVGLFKKMFIADNIAIAVNYCYEFSDILGFKTALFVILGYTLQIYMDFSGYSDMAFGISKMFNIAIPVNFNSPYKAVSITDFWKRWHISLTDFLRDYIYYPLGGSRKGKLRTALNIIIVFVISGLWHGKGLTFLVWGLLHGFCQVLERSLKKVLEKVPKLIRILFTFVIVNIGWVLFRAKDLSQFLSIITSLFKRDNYIVLSEGLKKCDLLHMDALLNRLGSFGQLLNDNSSLVILIAGLLTCFFCPNLYEKKHKYNVALSLVTVVLLLLEILSLNGAMTTFIYFNF
ncbi:MAG: MBOAT family protein [Lachnospiraceae bacterium]|nr:MBOAT family protein [Lachnospiraceae bacterium]